MKTVYLVYEDSHGLVGVYGTKDGARDTVEHISVVQYGMRDDSEIWTGDRGNELCYYDEEEVIYD